MEYLEAADVYRSTIRDIHGTPETYRESADRRNLADANANLGHALKAAEVCATLAEAEEIAALRLTIERAIDQWRQAVVL